MYHIDKIVQYRCYGNTTPLFFYYLSVVSRKKLWKNRHKIFWCSTFKACHPICYVSVFRNWLWSMILFDSFHYEEIVIGIDNIPSRYYKAYENLQSVNFENIPLETSLYIFLNMNCGGIYRWDRYFRRNTSVDTFFKEHIYHCWHILKKHTC